jgi:hypothetical protein
VSLQKNRPHTGSFSTEEKSSVAKQARRLCAEDEEPNPSDTWVLGTLLERQSLCEREQKRRLQQGLSRGRSQDQNSNTVGEQGTTQKQQKNEIRQWENQNAMRSRRENKAREITVRALRLGDSIRKPRTETARPSEHEKSTQNMMQKPFFYWDPTRVL